MENLETTVKNIVAEQFGLDAKKLSPNDRLDDLGADSLDAVELVLAIEDEYGLNIQDSELETFQTIDDITKYVQSHANID